MPSIVALWCSGFNYCTTSSNKAWTRFCADSSPANSVLEIRDGEDLWQWSRLEKRLNAFPLLTITQNNSSSSTSIHYYFDKFQLWDFSLKSSLMASNQHFLGWLRLLFPSTSKSKIFLVYTRLRFTCPHQRSLLHLNTESRLFSFNRPRREFVLTHCSSWCCTSIRVLPFHYTPNVSYHLVWAPNILINKASSLWHSCYIFDHVFWEIALQVSKSNSSLNFPHAGLHLLIVASSQPPPG